MASLRSSLSLIRTATRQGRRLISTRASTTSYKAPVLLGITAAGAAGYSAYKVWTSNSTSLEKAVDEAKLKVQEALPIRTVSAASTPEAQPSVFSQGKDHALYLWIHLKPTANAREVGRAMAKLQKYVDQVCDPSMKDEDDEVLAGVGFGPNFYGQVGGKTKENYTYPHRKCALGDMPSSGIVVQQTFKQTSFKLQDHDIDIFHYKTNSLDSLTLNCTAMSNISVGGDVFIHAKSNQVSKLFELAQVVMKNLPKDTVDKFEDVYSFVYQNGRDLSGFIDGTENKADEDERREVAVEKATGGSYVVTQKWIHELNVIGSEKDKTMEGWVGRQRSDSVELQRKPITSHVARMTGGNAFQQPKKFEIVRQSMPFGTLSCGAGLFFIGYAASPKNHEYMLSRMVGTDEDRHCDDIMRLTKNVKGTYWYFPGVAELKKLE